MPVYKNEKNGTWYVMVRYTEWNGERKQKCKRSFPTRRAALEWEREFLCVQKADINMTLESFVTLYEENLRPKLRESTWINKRNIIETKILPYLGKRKMDEITSRDVIAWQNEIRKLRKPNGEPYSATYLRNVHNQLSAIFNHAVDFYDLPKNPVSKAGSMGEKEAKEMQFWTKEEYLRFIDAMMDKPISYYAFEMLYWCGIREGELLALTPADFNFDDQTVSITKSYQRLKGRDIISPPKTRKGIRTVRMPQFLCDEMQDYLNMLYNKDASLRIFPITKSYLKNEMTRGCKVTGVKPIRIHDLRHSHVSLLIDRGFSALAIAQRVGHETIDITFRYAHLFPSKQTDMANCLENERIAKGGNHVPQEAGSPQSLAQ